MNSLTSSTPPLSDVQKKAKKKAYDAKWYSENPKRRQSYNLKARYGITVEHKEALLEGQNFRCAICSTDDPGSRRGWHLDHCHVTKSIRGILCHGCNTMLGGARDNQETLRNAIAYLAEARASNNLGK